eukprot:PhM_4_TR7493/c0_g1_i1/m.37964
MTILSSPPPLRITQSLFSLLKPRSEKEYLDDKNAALLQLRLDREQRRQERHSATCIIQRLARRSSANIRFKNVQKVRERRLCECEDNERCCDAATKFQAMYRGYRTRKFLRERM